MLQQESVGDAATRLTFESVHIRARHAVAVAGGASFWRLRHEPKSPDSGTHWPRAGHSGRNGLLELAANPGRHTLDHGRYPGAVRAADGGLDAIGGVDFEKGCYTGQEIVARTHYLGEVKRELRLGHGEGAVRGRGCVVECGTDSAAW